MEVPKYPLLSIYEVRRMVREGAPTPFTGGSSLTADTAAWSGVFPMHDRRYDLRRTMAATLFAVGNDESYTSSGRYVEATITSFRGKNKPPFKATYHIAESERGVTYVVVGFAGQSERRPRRTLTYSFFYKDNGVNHITGPTTAEDLIWKRTRANRERIAFNQDVTTGLLIAAGVIR